MSAAWSFILLDASCVQSGDLGYMKLARKAEASPPLFIGQTSIKFSKDVIKICCSSLMDYAGQRPPGSSGNFVFTLQKKSRGRFNLMEKSATARLAC